MYMHVPNHTTHKTTKYLKKKTKLRLNARTSRCLTSSIGMLCQVIVSANKGLSYASPCVIGVYCADSKNINLSTLKCEKCLALQLTAPVAHVDNYLYLR